MKLFTRFCIIVLCTMAASQAFAQNNVIQLRNGSSSTTLISGTGGTYTLTFPSSAGTNGQALTTNGSGTLSWSTPASSINSLTDAVSDATSNTLILGLEPAGLTVNALRNTSVGLGALTAISQGDENTVVGFNAGLGITTGSTNTLIGTSAGSALTTTSGNVMLGYQAGSQETGSNKLYIANSNTTTPLIAGDFNAGTVRFNGSVTTTGTTNFVALGTTTGTVTAVATSGSGAVSIGTLSTSTFQTVTISNAGLASQGYVRLPAGTDGQVVYLKITIDDQGTQGITLVNSDNSNTLVVWDGVGADVFMLHMIYTSLGATGNQWVIWEAIRYDNP